MARRPEVGESANGAALSSKQQSENSVRTKTKKQRSSLASVTPSFAKRVCFPMVEIASTNYPSHNQHINQRKKLEASLAITVRLIIVTFTFALLPTIVVMGTGSLASVDPSSISYNPVCKTMWSSFAYIVSRVLLSNSLANCIIYSYRSSEFREVVKSFLWRIISRNSKSLK